MTQSTEAFSNEVMQAFTQGITQNKNRKIFNDYKRRMIRMYLDASELKIQKNKNDEKKYHQHHADKQRTFRKYCLNNNQLFQKAEETFKECIVICE